MNINIDELPEEEKKKFYMYRKLQQDYLNPEDAPTMFFGSEYTIHTMKKEVFEKLEKIRLILEDNKIKLTTDELLDEIVSSELEKTKKFIKK